MLFEGLVYRRSVLCARSAPGGVGELVRRVGELIVVILNLELVVVVHLYSCRIRAGTGTGGIGLVGKTLD